MRFDYKIINSAFPFEASPVSFGTIDLQYSYSTNGPWTTIYTVDSANHVPIAACGNTKTVTFNTTPGNLFIRFFIKKGAGSSSIILDNINIVQVEIPACLSTNGLTTAGITTTSAKIAWQVPSIIPTNGYQYEIRTSGNAESGNSGLVDSGSIITNTQTITNLIPSTTYFVFVRVLCSTTTSSEWQNIGSFNTLCINQIAPTEIEDFSNYTNSIPSPMCWSKSSDILGLTPLVLTGTTSQWKGGDYTNSTTNPDDRAAMVQLYGTNNDWLISPSIDLGNGSTEFMIEYTTAILPSITTMEEKFVKVIVSTDNGGTWSIANVISTYDNTNIPTGGKHEMISLAGYTGVVKIGFYAYSISMSQNISFFIDNFKIDAVAPCIQPSLLKADNITATTTKLSWTSSGNLFDIEYGPSGFTEGNGALLEGVNNHFELNGINELDYDSNYSFYVRQDCGIDGKSMWSGPHNFTTGCTPILDLPWEEGFENIEPLGPDIFPFCWKKENGNWQTSNTSNYHTPRTGSNYLKKSDSTTNEYIHTPSFQLEAGTSYDFSFYAQSDGSTGWQVGLYSNTSQSNTTGFLLGEIYTPMGTGIISQQPYQKIKRTFVPTTSGVYTFTIQVYQPDESSWYIVFDDFKLEVTPSCLIPTTLTAENITSNSATLSWVGTGTNYTLEYGPIGFTPGTGVTQSNVTPPMNISGLDNTRSYSFHVKEECSLTDSSSYSEPITFMTLCGPEIAPTLVQTFDSYISNAPNPLCWSESKGTLQTIPTSLTIENGKWTNEAFAGTFGNSNSARINLRSTSKDWFISNQIDLGDGSIPFQLKYDVALTTYLDSDYRMIEFGNHIVKVIISTDGGITWENANTIKTYDNSSLVSDTRQTETIALTGYTGIVKIGFYAETFNSSPDIYFYIDNFIIEKSTICTVPTAISSSAITHNSATISWAPAGVETSWEYVIQPISTGSPPMTGISTSMSSVDITNLSVGTNYEVYLRSVCSETEVSDWSSALFFNTLQIGTGSTCENAIPIISSDLPYTTNDNTSNYGNHYSGVAGINCGISTNFLNGNNVVYAYTATNDGTINIELNPQESNVGLFVYGACNLIGNTCIAGAVNDTNSNPININGLSIEAGQTFYIMISSLTPPQSTAYTLTITGTLETETFNDENFSYYPNPVKDILNLSYSEKISSISIFNIMGQKVIQKTVNATQSQIDISSLKTGVFLVKVNSGNQTKSIKIIKQ